MSSTDYSFKAILDRMKNSLGLEETDIEGTWTADVLQAVANENARIYLQEIEPIYNKAFVTTAEGEDLDRACADYGFERNPATYAEGTVTIKGKSGTYTNLQVKADDIIFNVPEAVIITQSGSVNVRCICTVPGKIGNVPAGAIKALVENNPYITKVENTTATTGGYDIEAYQGTPDQWKYSAIQRMGVRCFGC